MLSTVVEAFLGVALVSLLASCVVVAVGVVVVVVPNRSTLGFEVVVEPPPKSSNIEVAGTGDLTAAGFSFSTLVLTGVSSLSGAEVTVGAGVIGVSLGLGVSESFFGFTSNMESTEEVAVEGALDASFLLEGASNIEFTSVVAGLLGDALAG